MRTKLWRIKIIARWALGLVWLYEGLVPKILFVHADEIDLVQRSGLVWRNPAWTLLTLGLAQMLVGLWLLVGRAERAAIFVATASMVILIILVARGNPGLLTDPYGALIKDLCLLACAATVWQLSPGTEESPDRIKLK
jgi:peptidoglycan/LPS O-acetylase OafA/YrhL